MLTVSYYYMDVMAVGYYYYCDYMYSFSSMLFYIKCCMVLEMLLDALF